MSIVKGMGRVKPDKPDLLPPPPPPPPRRSFRGEYLYTANPYAPPEPPPASLYLATRREVEDARLRRESCFVRQEACNVVVMLALCCLVNTQFGLSWAMSLALVLVATVLVAPIHYYWGAREW